jgi:hypothetical protein
VVGLAALGACAERATPLTAPTRRPGRAPALAAAAAPAGAFTARDALASAVDDALLRLLPAFGTGGEVVALRLALTDVGRALEAPANPRAALQEPTRRAAARLDALAQRHAGEPGALAELDALRLVLDPRGGPRALSVAAPPAPILSLPHLVPTMTSAFRDPSASAPRAGALPRLRAALTALTALPLAATALAAQTAPPPAVTPPAV